MEKGKMRKLINKLVEILKVKGMTPEDILEIIDYITK